MSRVYRRFRCVRKRLTCSATLRARRCFMKYLNLLQSSRRSRDMSAVFYRRKIVDTHVRRYSRTRVTLARDLSVRLIKSDFDHIESNGSERRETRVTGRHDNKLVAELHSYCSIARDKLRGREGHLLEFLRSCQYDLTRFVISLSNVMFYGNMKSRIERERRRERERP